MQVSFLKIIMLRFLKQIFSPEQTYSYSAILFNLSQFRFFQLNASQLHSHRLHSEKLKLSPARQEYINKKRFQASVADGFTLIELLVVFSIIGMTIGLGAFRWQHFQQQHELTSSMQKTLTFLSNIQTQANWDNQTYLIKLEKSAEQSCLIITRKSDNNLSGCQTTENNQERLVFTLPAKSVNFKSITPTELAFYGTRNSAKAGNIVIENDLGSLRLVLSVRGRLRICSETTAIKAFPAC